MGIKPSENVHQECGQHIAPCIVSSYLKINSISITVELSEVSLILPFFLVYCSFDRKIGIYPSGFMYNRNIIYSQHIAPL